ncbi:MAG: bis-aminopropyl spermidine synthase family protein [Armatimonadota bacterium]|nr:bis-aminopropyl spermidine synthase family protein [Armatimonadota bacterium]MDR7439198.1 bis-aminopropyl spermidine synthase family protein [Armatimonadota bacterium]MDR7562780.1 bis-aminopropyl spermidine synthase family protein [Armatimonadota bacterium]MDR7568295.1 bis-aminopropyl spermidine synthase family protein [Armatimonadota bacterium]MDR7600907.1 bis-aminopropyl spermidine synthase family protein [Armatimonadota bacterium]
MGGNAPRVADRREARKRLQTVLERVEARVPVVVSRRDAERALGALQVTGDLWEVFRLSRAPIRFLCAFLQELIAQGLVQLEGVHLRLSPEGRGWVGALGIPPAREVACSRCGGRGVELGALGEEVMGRFRVIARRRPPALQAFDQGYVTEETTLSRVAFALDRGDVQGKEVFVVGDDDLVSIALALTRQPRRVVVVDVDERIVGFIREVARREGLDMVEAHVYDVRSPLPEAWRARFDTFFTDPTESLRGFQAFMERGVAALQGAGSAGYFGLTHGESSLEKWARIQRVLLDLGAVITDIRDGFNVYDNWDYMETMRAWQWLPVRTRPEHLWYFSALFRIELLRTPSVENLPLEGNLFEDEEAATT